jgi:hypothetical protein
VIAEGIPGPLACVPEKKKRKRRRRRRRGGEGWRRTAEPRGRPLAVTVNRGIADEMCVGMKKGRPVVCDNKPPFGRWSV